MYLNKNRNTFNILECFIAIEGILSINPYILWQGYMYNYFFDIGKKLLEFSIIVFFLLKHKKINRNNFFMALSFAIVFLFYVLNNFDKSLSLGLGVIIQLLMIVIFLLLTDYEKSNVCMLFTKIFAISLIPGIIYSIISMCGINLPYGVIESSQDIKQSMNYRYTHYIGAVFLENKYMITSFKSLCGLYDEHGLVGTVSALLLVVNRFKLKDKKELIILIIGGILSVSLAFYIIVFIYYCYYFLKNKNIKVFATLCAIGVGTIILLFLFRNNDVVQRLIISRLDINYILSNKRADSQFQSLFSQYWKSNQMWFGNGNNNPIFNTVDAANYKVMLFNIGIIGFTVYIGWFIIWGIREIKKSQFDIDIILIFGILILSFLQRPWIHYLYYLIIVFGGIKMIMYEKKSEDVNLRDDGGTECK